MRDKTKDGVRTITVTKTQFALLSDLYSRPAQLVTTSRFETVRPLAAIGLVLVLKDWLSPTGSYKYARIALTPLGATFVKQARPYRASELRLEIRLEIAE